MTPTAIGLIFSLGLFLAMPLLLEVGRRIGLRRLAQDTEGARQGLGVVEGAVFSLLGLLIAFTFSGAASRFDNRRQLGIQEANDIGTAYLRLDMLPSASQPPLRQLFRQYVDSRLETARKLPDLTAAYAEVARSVQIQGQIWTNTVAACRDSGSPATYTLMLPALNAMIDITTTRTETSKIHPPVIIFVMLGILCLAASLLAGYGMAGSKTRSWVHIVVFSAVLAITVYVIIDIEYPRAGFIRMNKADRVFQELRDSMK